MRAALFLSGAARPKRPCCVGTAGYAVGVKASPVTLGAVIGGLVGALLLSPVAAYYMAPALVLSATFGDDPLFLGALIGGCLLTGALAGGSLGAMFGCAIAADRRNGGFRCRGEQG